MIIDIVKNRNIEDLKKILKSNKVDFNEKDKWGNSALNVSSDIGEFEMTKTLLEYPFNINAKGIDDYTPLHYAVSGRYNDIVKLLIDKKADLNIPDKYGNTPLMTAVDMFNGDDTIVKLLLKSGANPHIKNNYGVSVYKILAMPRNQSLIELFPKEEV